MLGITAAYEYVPQPLTAVAPAVGNNIVAVGNIILHLPQRMVDVWNAAFGSEARDPNGPISVVGVGPGPVGRRAPRRTADWLGGADAASSTG